MRTIFRVTLLKIVILSAVYSLVACATPGQGPMTWLDRPLDGEQYPLKPMTIQAHGSGAEGITGFEFLINETLITSSRASSGPFSQAAIDWLPPAPGTYIVRARAIGSGGTRGTEARAVILVGDATPTPTPSPTPTYPPPMCTPPKCNSDEVYFCPGACPGGCGTVCATRTPTPLVTQPLPVDTVTPTPTIVPSCPGAPVISSFTANPTTITVGGTSELRWGPILNADKALIDHGIGGPLMSGSLFPVSPSVTTTYVLTATGCGGTVTRSVTITVVPRTPTRTLVPVPVCPGPPVIASFSANPSTINAGQSTTLSWGAVTNATSASIDPGIGGVGTPGSQVVSPGGTTTYTLTATGCGGTVRRQVTVVVNAAPPPPPPPPPPPTTTSAPPPVDRVPPDISGVHANRTWITQQANSCPNTQRVIVSATVTDAKSGVNRVVARLGGVGSGEVGMSAVGGNVYQVTLGPFSRLGTVSATVVAWDNAGNSWQGGTVNVNVVSCIE